MKPGPPQSELGTGGVNKEIAVLRKPPTPSLKRGDFLADLDLLHFRASAILWGSLATVRGLWMGCILPILPVASFEDLENRIDQP